MPYVIGVNPPRGFLPPAGVWSTASSLNLIALISARIAIDSFAFSISEQAVSRDESGVGDGDAGSVGDGVGDGDSTIGGEGVGDGDSTIGGDGVNVMVGEGDPSVITTALGGT